MSWHLYSLRFQLRSPLHIGFHKVMHLFRTRAYVPAKPLWGALTAKLTPALRLTEYDKVGSLLKDAVRFGYFYLSDGNRTFIPKYTTEGLKFESLPQADFDKRFIGSMTSTAIEPYSFTAEEGMLHEVEYISPYIINDGKRVFIVGLLWMSELSRDGFSIKLDDNDISIAYNSNEVKLSELGGIIQIGGERKYGFGHVKLNELRREDVVNLKDLKFVGKWEEMKGEIWLELKKDEPIWSHLAVNPNLKKEVVKGSLEAVVGRDWDKKGAGRSLRYYGNLYWAPGSVLMEDTAIKITENFGLWERE
ncbi:MAG: RAMP superfamily CRISPR-associated protein [Methermicoccaceae archaeon]